LYSLFCFISPEAIRLGAKEAFEILIGLKSQFLPLGLGKKLAFLFFALPLPKLSKLKGGKKASSQPTTIS